MGCLCGSGSKRQSAERKGQGVEDEVEVSTPSALHLREHKEKTPATGGQPVAQGGHSRTGKEAPEQYVIDDDMTEQPSALHLRECFAPRASSTRDFSLHREGSMASSNSFMTSSNSFNDSGKPCERLQRPLPQEQQMEVTRNVTCGEVEDWFENAQGIGRTELFDWRPKMLRRGDVHHIGSPFPGDLPHLMLGVTYTSIGYIFECMGAYWRGDRVLPSWFKDTFPDAKFTGMNSLEEFLTGYESCDAAREWLEMNHLTSFSPLEVFLTKGCPGIGHANVFLSHAQAECVLDTLVAMEQAAKMVDGADGDQRLRFFVDIVSIRQHLHGDFNPASVDKVIKAIGHTVLLLAPRKAPWTIRRAWCMFEIFQTINTNTKFTAMPMFSRWSERWLDIRQEIINLQSFVIHLEDCKAREAYDRTCIMDEIEKNFGSVKANELTTTHIKDGVAGYLVWADQRYNFRS